MVATTITNCGRCTSKVGGAQLREATPVGSGSFSLSVRVAEATVSTAIRTLNSTGKPEAGTALAALLTEGSQLGFVGNPLLYPACFAKVSASYSTGARLRRGWRCISGRSLCLAGCLCGLAVPPVTFRLISSGRPRLMGG